MIAKISGRLIYRGTGFFIVEQGGIGYKLNSPIPIQESVGSDVAFFVHEVTREDGREWFAFRTMDEVELVWKLLTVNGVGPKLAQRIVAGASEQELRSHIAAGDISFLTGIPGIGKKIAQKIILDLKGELAAEPEALQNDRMEAVDALISLGYQKGQAEDVIRSFPLEVKGTELLVREALKSLARA